MRSTLANHCCFELQKSRFANRILMLANTASKNNSDIFTPDLTPLIGITAVCPVRDESDATAVEVMGRVGVVATRNWS